MRIQNSAKNLGTGIATYLINLLVNFACRTIFIYLLGAAYLGINGLFANVLSVLSLAELGFGSIIIYNMYKPVAQKDYEKVKSLLGLYKKIYIISGLVVLCIGLVILPFIQFLIKDVSNIKEDIRLLFLLYLVNTVIGYFSAYKRAVINVHQNKRVETVNSLVFFLILNIIQTVILFVSKNYILYLTVKPVITLLENISITAIVNKKYPMLLGKYSKLTKSETKSIYKNALAMLSHKIGGVVLGGTDSIIISTFLGLTLLGYYSNYLLIITSVTAMILIFINSISASVGNAIASESTDIVYTFFKRTAFALFWVLAFCATSLMALFQPFISIWLSKADYLLNFQTVIIIVANFYLYISRYAIHPYKDGAGLFWNDRWKPIIEVILNLAISLLLVQVFGISGVLLGTIISSLLTGFWVEPYVLFKNYFKKNVGLYFILFFKYTAVAVLACVGTYFATVFLPNGIMYFLLRILICAIVPNLVFGLIFCKTAEFAYYKNLFFKVMSKIFKRRGNIQLEQKDSDQAITAVIIAGEKDSKHSSLTKNEVLKPMTEICGKPILLWQIEALKENGIYDYIFIVGFLKEKIIDYFGDGSEFGVKIEYIEEEQPFSTGGSLDLVKDKLKGNDFILTFGDTLFSIDLVRMLNFHKDVHSDITLFVHPNGHPQDSDLVFMNSENRIIGIDSKNNVRSGFFHNCVNAGFYLVNKNIFQIPLALGKCAFEKDMIQKNLNVIHAFAYQSTEYIKNVGTDAMRNDSTDDIKNNVMGAKNLKNAQRAIFIDRDGIFNTCKGLIDKAEDLELIDLTADAVKMINKSDYLVFLIGNQPVVAKNLCTIADVETMHLKIETLLGEKGAYLDGIYFCPHHADKGYQNKIDKVECDCNKPKIGLLHKAQEKFNIDFAQSWVVGTTSFDIKTGIHAGCKPMLVQTGQGEMDMKYNGTATLEAENLLEAVEIILKK